MIIKKYLSTITDIQSPIPGVYTLTFECQKKFKFYPGQFLHIAIDSYDPSMQWPDSRCFSMQSAPSDQVLKITYTVVGKYTQRMSNELKVDQKVWLKLPYGDLFQRGLGKDNCVFIAGGTGITPFLSLLNDSAFIEYPNPTLYLGFKNKDYNIYSDGLEKAKSINPSLVTNILYEDEQGRLDIDQIFNKNGRTNYYISGPPVMIKIFRQYLLKQGLEEEHIVIDDWE